MGFEELAGLKQLLSKRTQAEKPGRGDAPPRGQAAKPVEGQHAAKPPRSQASKPHGANGAQRQPAGSSNARPHGKPAGRPAVSGKPDGRVHHNAARAAAAPQTARGPRPEKRQTPTVEPVVITIGQLQKRFPNAFPKNPAPKVPLKLGISKDLIAQAESMTLSEPELLEAIKVWCQGSRYWAAMTKDAPRVDLEGKPEGVVTPEQAARARSLLAASRRAKRPQAKKPASDAATAAPDAAADTVTHTAATPDTADATLSATADTALTSATAPSVSADQRSPDTVAAPDAATAASGATDAPSATNHGDTATVTDADPAAPAAAAPGNQAAAV